MKKIRKSQLNKRILSIMTAFVMLIVSMPVSDISDGTKSLFNEIMAEADDIVTYDIDPDGTCHINSYSDLVTYSQAYRDNPSSYSNVGVKIAIAGQCTETDLQNFVSIGTEAYPFNATIIINNSNLLNIYLDIPLFEYIYDTSEIIGTDDAVSKVTILRTSNATSEPLFARNVVHNNSSDSNTVFPQWSVAVGSSNESTTKDFSGIIGTIGENAQVDLLIDNTVNANVSGDGDVGLACGTMEAGSKLSVTLAESAAYQYGISSTSGNAGGLVGSMQESSELTINSDVNTSGTISAGKYAGGLVGYVKNANVVFADKTFTATVSGTSGTGGVFGYYENTEADYNLYVSSYNVDCTLNGKNNGGLFGVLKNSGSMTINGFIDESSVCEIKSTRAATDKETYGGLIGTYSSDATSNILEIKNINTLLQKDTSAGAQYYGGVIAKIDDSYVKINNVTASAKFCENNVDNYGGLVASSDGAFIDVTDVTINTNNSNFKGGGIVGNLNSGVLCLNGKTDLSQTGTSNMSGEFGQIVKKRGNQALVYANSDWQLIRSSNTPQYYDDIFSWGEVLRFSDKLSKDDVLIEDTTNHTITVQEASTTISTLADFAKLALNIQMNNGATTNNTLKFDDTTNSKSSTLLSSIIDLSADIYLSGTGLTGLTRDNGSNDAFTGTFNGNNHKISLAVGEPYGYRKNGDSLTQINSDEYAKDTSTAGNGVIYRHQYIGLFAKTGEGAKFNDLTIGGKIKVDDNINMSIGYLSGQHTGGTITINNVTASKDSNDEIYLNSNGSATTGCGGFIGKVAKGAVEIYGCTISPKINKKESNANGPFRIGGAIGEIISTTDAITVNVKNTTIGAEINNNSNNSSTYTGGFIGYIADTSSANENRQINLNDLTIDGATITSGVSDSTTNGGGLLGQNWNNVQVTIGDESGTKGITVKSGTVTYNGTGDFAGLVTVATGYWKVYNIDINGITINGSTASSFGMLVNKGFWQDSGSNISKQALYLELENENAYKITSANLAGLNENATFDELVADCRNYNVSNNKKVYYDIASNGNAVVSIHTSIPDGETEPKVIMDGTKCNTYQNQTSITTVNPNTRYYYNLDVIRGKETSSMSPSEKLLLWSVKKYAYSSLSNYFTNPFDNDIIESAKYDMDGFSYYPVDINSNITISEGATFKFYNSEIESSENGTGNTDSTSRSTMDKSQHYLMHCGLFRNVSENLTVKGAAFSGNVGNVNNYCGALVCGTISTSSTTALEVNIDSVTLDGIQINGFTDTLDYAPLLINKINSNVKLVLKNVSTPVSAYNGGVTVATSLIGNVGGNDADNIKLTFSGITLDGRKNTGIVETLNDFYHTTRSIFTKATLLNKYQYQTGKNCSAVYNYKLEEDWDSSGNAVHKVTYGKEISNSAEYQDAGQQKQYIDKEIFTDPTIADNTIGVYDFSENFLPYVATPYDTTATDDSLKNCHEIKVNHKVGDGLEKGCGTYNDPYIIETAEQLILVATILGSDTLDSGYNDVKINFYSDNYKSWCNSDHITYKYDADQSKFVNESNSSITKSLSDMQTALSTAYYKFDNNEGITLPETFLGLGKTIPFKGVIWGAGNTITNASSNPLIYNSKGTVIKDLTVKVTSDFSSSFKNVTEKSTYETDGGTTPFYGGIFGIVNGGDNIIYNVNVTIDNATNITSTGSYAGNVAVGGYVGVVRYGGVIFRNMSGAEKPDFSGNTKFGDVDKIATNNVYLYFNPIIGRVIDGYAFTETDGTYTPRETAEPTMQNGTKNYSIADINKNGGQITFDGSTIKVPDGQSLFIMGCMAMSGAGSANISTGQYSSYSYGSSQMVRGAEYNHIGEDTTTDDYNLAKVDNFANTSIPYIISKYTNDTTSARKLTTGTFSIELTGTETYTLPDSFRGIGSMNNASDNLEMTLSGFDGKGQTIEMNSNFYAYKLNGGYDQYYNVNGTGGESGNDLSLKTGIGLFNKLVMSEGSEIKDLTLSGTVKVEIYENSNSKTRQSDNNASMCAGMLAGISMNNTSFTVNSVKLSDATVDTMSISGGLIGVLKNGSGKTFTANRVSADNLSVSGGQTAGGMVGYVENFTCKVNVGTEDNLISEFLINNISANSTSGNWNRKYQGCGGIFGALQKSTVDINNISIGKSTAEDSKGSITSYSNTSFTGGVIGCGKNGSNDTIKNAVNTTITLSNINVIGDENNPNTIKGYTEAGGLIGLQLGEMTADNCTVENYNMQTTKNVVTEGVGGFIGKSESISGTAQTAVLKNSKISNCNIQTDYGKQMPAGMIVGMTNNKIQFSGYNILVNNVQLTKLDGTKMTDTVTVGNITGHIYNGSAVKLVGLCKQNESDITSVNDFGTNKGSAYVIYSDYNGTCLEDGKNTTASTINNGSDVTDMGKSPFATINPKAQIDSTNILTSDGISGKETVENILSDTERYTNVTADKTTFEQYKDKLSTFNKETGANIATDFPVIVINDPNNINVTNMINSYIHLLTNDTSMTNYASDEDGKYQVVISKYRMNDGSDTFTEVTDEDDKPTLNRTNGEFSMSNKDYDISHTQFTLIDVQYYEPDTTNVAYHLYIPVMVEKMLKFDFTAKILSGTTYKSSEYVNNVVMERYGSPITAYMTYSYKRTCQEWQEAINLGENLLTSYGKTVILKSGNDALHLPKDTQLVLVDRNNSDKAYYSTMESAFNATDNKLTFRKFKSADGISFESVTLYDLLNRSAIITVTEDENGKFVECNQNEATIKTDDGKHYKLKESETDTLYSIAISPKDSSIGTADILPVTEDYYLSFFTPENAESTVDMVQITILSANRLIDDGMTPSRNDKCDQASMILGDLYSQEFTFSTTTANETISDSNKTIEAKLTSTITLKGTDDNKKQVMNYLGNSAINVYHGFIIDLTKTYKDENEIIVKEKGVKGSPYVTGTYNIGDTRYSFNKICSESEIELTAVDNNGMIDISSQLKTGNPVIISCNDLKITYTDINSIVEQFPKRKNQSDTDGVTFSAVSNIAYIPTNVHYSNISQALSTPDQHNYYREGDVTVANLSYNIPTGVADADEFAKLGVNGWETSDKITAVGYYDVSEFPEEELAKAEQISVELSLFQKTNEGNYQSVDIGDYLNDVKLYKQDGTEINLSTDINSFKHIFGISDLSSEYGLYEIDSSYSVITGEEFEKENKLYSNYKLQMTVQLLDGSGNSIANSSCSDYIIYTNAKIYTEFLKT